MCVYDIWLVLNTLFSNLCEVQDNAYQVFLLLFFTLLFLSYVLSNLQ